MSTPDPFQEIVDCLRRILTTTTPVTSVTSTTGVGEVLYQQQGIPAKLHLCAFTCKITSAERNYDIGNRELLTIKLALEEWRD